MRTFKKLSVLAFAILAGFVLASGAYAQDVEDEEIYLEELDLVDHANLIARLQVTFQIEIEVLEAYIAEGYSPGELWLALEIAAETQLSLDEALIVTDGASGHGWGLLAQKLGIDPGSNEFHALKARWTERKGALLGNTYFRGKADNDQGSDTPRGPKSNKSGKSDGSGPEPQSSGNRSGASASSGKK
ncbi:hypothetical protein SDC9_16453 [bioreactor metagenome]|uniref:Uncharacterized protein n=1 Tax=bioreactor metagenome TaxID=1076179 RepID=A0A644TUQ7_9ZZZZ|nr:hypothetical protein [Spirochaetales bacterium]